MWKKIVIFSAFIVLCACEREEFSIKKKYHHHHYDKYLLFGGFQYLTFLLIKAKVVFTLGLIFTFFLVIGKVFAVVKYLEYTKQEKHHSEPEKIYIQSPGHDHHDFGGGPSFDSVGAYSSNSFESSYGPPMSQSGVTYDKLPPNAEIAGGGGGQYYGRGYAEESGGGFLKEYDRFLETIRTLNISDVAFRSMKLDSDDCKRKFVCEAEFNARHSSVLSASLEFLRDESYDRYRTNGNVTLIEECGQRSPGCVNEDT